MPLKAKKLVLTKLAKGELFKVAEGQQIVTLTLDKVYMVTVVRADHAKAVRIADAATIRRPQPNTYQWATITIPMKEAKALEVYRLPLLRN